jgi:hypothetical protein
MSGIANDSKEEDKGKGRPGRMTSKEEYARKKELADAHAR